MPNPPNNNDLQRERVRFLNRSLSLQNIIKQGSIANGSRDNVLPALTPSMPVSPSVTPTNTKTPTPSITNTPTITITQTPTISITPSLTLTPTTTPTPTITPTVSITPSITPTISVTPTITPTMTPTPVQLMQLFKNQDILLLGLKDNVFDVPSEFNKLNGFNLKELNGLYRVETLNEPLNPLFDVFNRTIIRRYNVAGQQLPVLQSLSGQYVDNTWNLIFEIDSQDNTGSLFIGPSSYGSTLSLPVSNFYYDDLTIFSDQFSIQDAYVTSNFTNPTVASSAIMIRGLSSLDYNFNTLSGSMNGIVLYRVPGLFNSAPSFSAQNFYGEAYLSREFNVFRDPQYYWLLTLLDSANSFVMGLSSSNNQNTLPFSGFRADVDHTYTSFVSTNVNSVRLIDVNQDNFYIPPPTPSVTPTISITPTITPTISITPTITPTNTTTPTTTPTVSLTPSITPTITPTITITSTLNIPDSVPVWSTNAVRVYDPQGNWSYLGDIYYKEVYDGVPSGVWRPGGGDNGIYPPNYGYQNPYDRWVFHNTDGYSYLLHPEANDPNFIPKTGWPGGVTLSAYS